MHEHETKTCAVQGSNQRIPWICSEKADYMPAVMKDIKRLLLNTVTGFFGNFCLFVIALCCSPLKNQKRLSWCNLTTNKSTLMKIPESLDGQTEYFHYIHLKSKLNSTTSRKCSHVNLVVMELHLAKQPQSSCCLELEVYGYISMPPWKSRTSHTSTYRHTQS